MELYLPIDPADIPSAQQKGAMVRNGRIMFYEKTSVKQARQAIINALIACSNGERLRGLKAYSCLIVYVYRPKTIKRSEFGSPKVTRPDLDNVSKLVLDAITDSHIAWEDDGQASTIAYRKRYAEESETAYVYINIEADRKFDFERSSADYPASEEQTVLLLN